MSGAHSGERQLRGRQVEIAVKDGRGGAVHHTPELTPADNMSATPVRSNAGWRAVLRSDPVNAPGRSYLSGPVPRSVPVSRLHDRTASIRGSNGQDAHVSGSAAVNSPYIVRRNRCSLGMHVYKNIKTIKKTINETGPCDAFTQEFWGLFKKTIKTTKMSDSFCTQLLLLFL